MKSWNEIRKAATAFSKRWKDAYDEKSQAQSFLKEFFAVFGVDIVLFNTFEHRVKFGDGSQGYADCFWQGKILVEMKSRGKDLDVAYSQALDYVRALSDVSQAPRAIVVSDFVRVRFYDLANDCALTEFALKDLRKFVTLFGYMIGADERAEIREQDPVNRKAAEKMAKLHDAMKAVGYTGHPLEVYLVRLLFCLFAEDTGIFKPNQFGDFIEQRTSADGSDLAAKLAELFQVLNTPPEKRLATRDESLAAFPYVNGGLFAECLPIAAFSPEMRRAILDCGELDWSKISPAIFGAMFQGVMDEKARHDLGAHYTSEENILKLIKPLFLDALRVEFDGICALRGNSRPSRLRAFHDKIASLTFLDPACGCGNFLLIGYRELRHIEMDVLDELHKDDPSLVLDVTQLCKVNVSQFYGIEIEPFPAEIAKVALWLMDHLCNMEVADRFGQYFARIPIKDSPHIVCANALTTDWPRTDYIMGNPPFLGRMQKSAEQQAEIDRFFDYKDVDFVACWHAKAAECSFLAAKDGRSTGVALVSTNSITQGEQVAPLWRTLGKFGVKIDFAYRTFRWHNEAKGVAAVHCVIIGFHSGCPVETAEKYPALRTMREKARTIYDSDGTAISASHINGYLVDAPDIIVESHSKPLCDVPRLSMGNMPLDGGNLIIEANQLSHFAKTDGTLPSFVKRLTGSKEYIQGLDRWCLWLKDVEPSAIRSMPLVMERVAKCREWRLASKSADTRKHAATPMIFREQKNPKTAIIIPSVSSERREYVPIGFIDDSVIVTNLAFVIPDATLYHFGILSSRMHMSWMRAVAGRLKSDYRYSKDIVYNNFVWPELSDSAVPREKISEAAQAILDARAAHQGATLADLYDPLTMPPDLVKAHAHLDALVDKAYGLKPTAADADRVALLFKLYAEKTKAWNPTENGTI
ncbi:MAG: class I SAM-dependent DNA methyltransferase [Kiritimatiellae bacterium]|nr:class I SAM-dependent DNA methyltransferase [Kiritimatiellia bacterium]